MTNPPNLISTHPLTPSQATQAAPDGTLASLPRGTVQRLFPFPSFFADAPEGSMWAGASEEEDLSCAQGCISHLEALFQVRTEYVIHHINV